MKTQDIIPNSRLITDLSSNDYHTRWFAAEVLGTKRDLTLEEVESVAKIAKNSDVGEVLVWGLGMMKIPGAESLIGSFLEHPVNYYRWRAAEALRDLGTNESIRILTHYLKTSKEGETRWKCAWALGEIGEMQSSEVLWETAKNDPDRYTRWKSVWGLTRLKGDIESFIQQKLVLSDINDYMRWRGAWILGKIGTRTTSNWLEKYRKSYPINDYVNYQVALAIDAINKRLENE